MGLPAPGRAGVMRDRPRHHLRFCLALVGCAVAITACGSSSKLSRVGSAGSGTIAMLDRYSACMRAHGVSGFPDPSTTETPNSFGIDGYSFDLPISMNTQSPAYESAVKTCQSVLGSGSGHGPSAASLARAKRQALARAVCMRAHGVPNFPDPTVSSNGQGITVGSGGGGIDPQSPAFQEAEKSCQPQG